MALFRVSYRIYSIVKVLVYNDFTLKLKISTFIQMTTTVKNRIEALTKKAKEGGIKRKAYKSSSRSSLHGINRTQAQARRFMRLLEAAQVNKK